MLDQSAAAPAGAAETVADTYDYVVIGAGIAGLNALYAATDYQPKGARSLLIDQKDAAGGMWNTAYDYVRLHQPHPMFTVGELRWNWSKPREYLARRDEVQAHLSGSLAAVRAKVDLDTAFGHTVTAVEEIETPQGHRARVTFHPNGDPTTERHILARRAVHAAGLNYRPAKPLTLSSAAVTSIIPQELRATLADTAGAPVYVIGGGKTGMDTILETLRMDPSREVTLVGGPATYFASRSKLLPTGLSRWTTGELVSQMFRALALNFDGDNDTETLAFLRETYSTTPGAPDGVFLYGLQSEDERARIDASLAARHFDYLTDVTDTEDGPVMTLRSGAQIPVAPGSIVVNCTGSFFRGADMAADMPILSPHDTVLTLGPRDAIHFLTSVSGYFGVHLMERGLLRGQGFYQMDLEGLFRTDRKAWVGATAAQAYLSQALCLTLLPMSLLDRCGLDFDRWYPLPRRLIGLIRAKSTAKADIAHCQKVLDRVGDRFDLLCRPLD